MTPNGREATWEEKVARLLVATRAWREGLGMWGPVGEGNLELVNAIGEFDDKPYEVEWVFAKRGSDE